MMKIVALIPLIHKINNLVDILNMISNMAEHNFEFVEELNIAMKKNLDQYSYTVELEFDLDELIAELAALGTCVGLKYKDILIIYLKIIS